MLIITYTSWFLLFTDLLRYIQLVFVLYVHRRLAFIAYDFSRCIKTMINPLAELIFRRQATKDEVQLS